MPASRSVRLAVTVWARNRSSRTSSNVSTGAVAVALVNEPLAHRLVPLGVNGRRRPLKVGPIMQPASPAAHTSAPASAGAPKKCLGAGQSCRAGDESTNEPLQLLNGALPCAAAIGNQTVPPRGRTGLGTQPVGSRRALLAPRWVNRPRTGASCVDFHRPERRMELNPNDCWQCDQRSACS